MRCAFVGLALLPFVLCSEAIAQPQAPLNAGWNLAAPEGPIAGLPPPLFEPTSLAPAAYLTGGPQPVVDPLLAGPPAGGQQPCADGPCDHCHCAPCECPCPPAACLPCPRINLINPCWQLLVGGNITLDMLFNNGRPVAPGTPFFLTPNGPFDQDTFDMHARQTSMYFAAMGPEIGEFRSGGLILFNFYNDNVVADRYGFLPIQAYGELKNEDWRFAGGLQTDIFAPLLPTVLPFSYLMASGNTGVFRGQLRAERFFYPAEDEQITFIAGISEPISTTINDSTVVTGSTALTEDNGWPDVEMRLAWAVGQPQQVGLEAKRPFEVGISTVLGQVRTTITAPQRRVVDDVWGVAVDFRWRVDDRWGFAGEMFHGQTLGTYGGGVFQNVNSLTFQPVHATGGWGEVYYYFTPCLHTHAGFGIDDPANSELAFTQIGRNETIFANVIWDVTQNFRLAAEFTYRETDYLLLPDNNSTGIHGQMQWKF